MRTSLLDDMLINTQVQKVFGLFILTISLSSCTQIDSNSLNKLASETDSLYQSENIERAEYGLLKLRQRLIQWKKSEIQVADYDHMLGILNARLFKLYKHKGDEGRASVAFKHATNHLSNARVAHGGKPKTYTEEEVIRIVELADRNLNVKWKNVFPANEKVF